jgi:hypothetical protein
MRRSFKVATVFTGVAAVTGGFGPTAFAATAQTTAIQPDLANQVCGANNDGISNWVHLYYPNDDHSAECFHGKGNHAAAGTIASFCPGNNIGSLRGTAQGANASFSFSVSEGRHPISSFEQYGGYFTLTGISIRSWKGDAKCT